VPSHRLTCVAVGWVYSAPPSSVMDSWAHGRRGAGASMAWLSALQLVTRGRPSGRQPATTDNAPAAGGGRPTRRGAQPRLGGAHVGVQRQQRLGRLGLADAPGQVDLLAHVVWRHAVGAGVVVCAAHRGRAAGAGLEAARHLGGQLRGRADGGTAGGWQTEQRARAPPHGHGRAHGRRVRPSSTAYTHQAPARSGPALLPPRPLGTPSPPSWRPQSRPGRPGPRRPWAPSRCRTPLCQTASPASLPGCCPS
jgi:hypothetical protein